MDGTLWGSRHIHVDRMVVSEFELMLQISLLGGGMMMLMARCLNGRYDSRVGAMILHWHRALHDGVDVCSECLFYFIIYERHSTIKPLLCGKFSVVAQSRPV